MPVRVGAISRQSPRYSVALPIVSTRLTFSLDWSGLTIGISCRLLSVRSTHFLHHADWRIPALLQLGEPRNRVCNLVEGPARRLLDGIVRAVFDGRPYPFEHQVRCLHEFFVGRAQRHGLVAEFRYLGLEDDVAGVDSFVDVVDSQALLGVVEPRPEVRISPS